MLTVIGENGLTKDNHSSLVKYVGQEARIRKNGFGGPELFSGVGEFQH